MSSTTQTMKAAAAPRAHRYFRRRYVWQWPIRIFHWSTAISVFALFATGLYMASPVLAPAGEPWNHFVQATVRKVHFAFAYVLLVAFLWRSYWFWMGNNFARSGFPRVWLKGWWDNLFRQAMDYLKLERGHVHLGHNALAGVAYTLGVIGLGWIQIFVGFSLYSQSDPDGFWGRTLGWVIWAMGGAFPALMWHHLFGWFFMVFAILHVYIVFYDGQQFKNGLVTSMVSGEKFYEDDDIDANTWIS